MNRPPYSNNNTYFYDDDSNSCVDSISSTDSRDDDFSHAASNVSTYRGRSSYNSQGDIMARNIVVTAAGMQGGKAALSYLGRMAGGGGGMNDIVDEDDIVAGAAVVTTQMSPAQ